MRVARLLPIALGIAAAATSLEAQFVVGATGVSASAGLPDGYSAPTSLNSLINQSGLSANYVSGVTSFAPFATSTTACYACSAGGGLSELGGVAGLRSTITFDLGGLFNISGLAIWNQAGTASLRSFDLSGDAGFIGSFTMNGNSQNFPQPASVFSFASMATQSLTMTITANEGYSGGTIINEVAFNGSMATVPEPSSFALVGAGLMGVLTLVRRRGARV